MTDTTLASVMPKIEGQVAARVREHHLPGAAVGVVRGGKLAWSAGIGFADIAAGRRPDAHTLYRVASISKTVTATAVMQMRDAGKLRLDDPIGAYLPEFGSVRARVGRLEDATFRRLLSHRSGLITEGPFSYWDSREFPAMEEVLAKLGESELAIAPDTAAKYSNLAFALMGEVVARLSGRPFETYARESIFAPLGMASSTFAPEEAPAERLAVGYDPHPFEDEPAPAGHTSARGIAAAAGLYTTVADLARWIAFHLGPASAGGADAGLSGGDGANAGGIGEGGDAPVLSAATIAEMQRPQDIDPAWTFARCLGWMAQRRGERIYHGHGGSIHGFITQIRFSVPQRLGVIVLTNEGRHGAADLIATEMLDALVEAGAGVAAAGEWTAPAPTPVEWRPYLGRYEFWRGGLVHVEARGGRLVLALPPGIEASLHAPSPLEPTEESHVFRVDAGRGAGELLRFDAGEDGSVRGFVLAGFRYVKLRGAEET